MRQLLSHIVSLVLLAWVLLACNSRPEHVQTIDQLPAIYPDYIGVTIPVGIAPLNFSMADDDFTDIDVEIKGKKGGSLHANGSFADFDIDDWHQLLEKNKGSQLIVSVYAQKDGQWYQYRDFTIDVSPYPLEEWGITYRRIPPSYMLYSHMGLYQRNLSDFEEMSMMENSQIHGNCLNCHTQNRTNPDQYVFHVRGAHGATVISKSEKRKVNSEKCLRVMFVGSSEVVLAKITKRAAVDYPNLEVVTYSPPYKPEFSEEDNRAIIQTINEANPDLLWIGMTAPKQEKWTYQHWKELDIHCHVGTIGAVFDFYAGTSRRAPIWWQHHSLEWLYRLILEPKRMWKRYVVGNPLFLWNIWRESKCLLL